MHWTDIYSHERDMEYRLRDHHGDAHHRQLRKAAWSAGSDGGRSWFESARDGLNRSAGLVTSAADGLFGWFESSEPQEQCC